MLIDDLLKKIDLKLPARSAIEGDRIGLQIQSGSGEITKIIVTLELNEEVVEEAAHKDCECIITFHPLIYTPLLNITNDNRVGILTQKLIKHNLTLISIHTNFDSFIEGTSKILANKLGFITDGFLMPNESILECGMGVIAHSVMPLKETELLEKVSSICKSPLRWTPGKSKEITKLAIVGGSGFSFIENVIESKVDAFITADISYHKFHEVYGKLMLIDPGHYEMEQFVPEALASLIRDILSTEEIDSVIISETVTNPVKYYPDTDKYIKLQSLKN